MSIGPIEIGIIAIVVIIAVILVILFRKLFKR